MSQALTIAHIEEKIRTQLDRMSERAGYYFKPSVFGIAFTKKDASEYYPSDEYPVFVQLCEAVALANPEPGSRLDALINQFMDTVAGVVPAERPGIDVEALTKSAQEGGLKAMLSLMPKSDRDPSAPSAVKNCEARVLNDVSGTLEAKTWRDLIVALNRALDEDLKIDLNVAVILDKPTNEERSRA